MGLSKSDMDLVILGILMGAPLHGYMLKQAIEGSYGDRYFKLSNSALYPTLARLEHDGYIEGKRELQETVPDRKVYHITETGKKRLIELVAMPIEPSSSPGATDYSFKVHAVHFGFITKEQRRNVTLPLYEDAKSELKEALEKREKIEKDFEKFNEYIKKSGQDTEQFKVLNRMSQLPLVVLEEGIEELKHKVRFYERIMELG
jgi:DNA-binding PadR family transcriptional regulator